MPSGTPHRREGPARPIASTHFRTYTFYCRTQQHVRSLPSLSRAGNRLEIRLLFKRSTDR
jgi:hypothetical protein